jgi:zinc transporter, ZIP family
MPVWASAGLWGLLAASSLLIGAAVAFLLSMPRSVTAGIMSFGCGVLISAVAYDLLEDGFQEGGIWPIVAGSIAGSIAYALADWLVSRNGAQHRKRSGDQQQKKDGGGGLAIAIGSLLDGIPESVVLGVGLLAGKELASRCSRRFSCLIFRKGYPARLECGEQDEASSMCSASGQ